MKIGELAERSRVTAKTIRYYEGIGLVPEPGRTSSNYRDYGEDAVERLRFIRDSQVAGLSLAEVGSILEMKDAGQSTCSHTQDLVQRHIDEIDQQMAALRQNRKAMIELADAAGSMDPGGCSDPQRCQVISGYADDAHAAHFPRKRRSLALHSHA